MNTTQGLAVATAWMLSAGMASATDFDHGSSKSATAALPWRNAPPEIDSFATLAAGGPQRAWASPQLGYAMPPQPGTFEPDPAWRDDRPPGGGGDDRPPGGDLGPGEPYPTSALVPVPEPHISSLLLAGLGAIGLIGLRRRRLG